MCRCSGVMVDNLLLHCFVLFWFIYLFIYYYFYLLFFLSKENFI